MRRGIVVNFTDDLASQLKSGGRRRVHDLVHFETSESKKLRYEEDAR